MSVGNVLRQNGSVELLERDPFLQTLGEYADDAVRGQGRLVLVSGEAGIGKTALLDTFATRRTDLRWLRGGCDGGFTPRPLGPLFEIATADGDGLLEQFRSGADRNTLFATSLERLGTPGRATAVVVEDLHWADEATLDWLGYLARRLSSLPTLVLLTYRDQDLGAESPLRSALAAIATQRATRRMSLPPLTARAVLSLTEAQGRSDAVAIYRLTGGNPFYVGELLSNPHEGVPSTVSDVEAARTAPLTDDARQLVWAAAILGQPLRPRPSRGVAGREPAHLDECLATGGLVSTRRRPGHAVGVLPVPARAGQAGRRGQGAGLPRHPAARRRLPVVLGAAPSRTRRGCAHHADAAGLAEQALAHATLAAREAAALASTTEAAAAVHPSCPLCRSATDAERAELHEGLAVALSLMDRWADCAGAPPARGRPRPRERATSSSCAATCAPWPSPGGGSVTGRATASSSRRSSR